MPWYGIPAQRNPPVGGGLAKLTALPMTTAFRASQCLARHPQTQKRVLGQTLGCA